MKVLRVKGTNIFDLFQGSGWEHHSRYKKVYLKNTKRFLFVHVSGAKLPIQQLKEVLG